MSAKSGQRAGHHDHRIRAVIDMGERIGDAVT